MNAQSRIAADAKAVERNAQRANELDAIAERVVDLARITRLNLSPMNPHLLWAEWHFTKAIDQHFSSDDTGEWFDEACSNLNVDREGEPDTEGLAEAEGDYRADMRREMAV